MKNLKKELIKYLEKYGKTENVSYVELYETFPFDGIDITNKQKGDRVRSVWKRMKQFSYQKPSYININTTAVVPAERVWENLKKELLIESPQMKTVKEAELVTEIDDYTKYQPEEDGNYLILGCVHAPFVNKAFWKALCDYALSNRKHIKGLILNGDFLDLNSLSTHDKGKMPLEGVNLGWEYKESQNILKQLTDNLLPDTYFGYLYGNHEDRQKRYMTTPDGQKLKGGVLTPEKGLNLSKDWNVFTDWKNDEIQLGDLTVIHGEFFSVHLCKKYLDTFRKNMLFAHSHRQQLYREGNDVAYNIGCMLDINSPAFSYASKAMKQSWTNGFALATLHRGKTNVQLVTWNGDHFRIGNEKYN